MIDYNTRICVYFYSIAPVQLYINRVYSIDTSVVD